MRDLARAQDSFDLCSQCEVHPLPLRQSISLQHRLPAVLAPVPRNPHECLAPLVLDGVRPGLEDGGPTTLRALDAPLPLRHGYFSFIERMSLPSSSTVSFA